MSKCIIRLSFNVFNSKRVMTSYIFIYLFKRVWQITTVIICLFFSTCCIFNSTVSCNKPLSIEIFLKKGNANAITRCVGYSTDHCAKCCILPCIMCSGVKCVPTFWAQAFRKKIFHFNFLIQLFIYLYLETKLIIVFQGIILHMDIVIVF